MKIKAVLFDMDGVLIDAKEWHYEALNKALNLFGYNIERYEHLTSFDGLPTSVKLEKLTVEKGLPRSLHKFINEMKQKYGVYSSPDEIDFDQLPDSFVLKSNWGSGQQIIVKNKKELNKQDACRQMKKWMERESNHYFFSFEHGYRHIEPHIVCEEFLDYEYKLEFFCFNGKPRFFWIVINDKTSDVHANFYELDWKRIPVSNHYPNFDMNFPRPECYDEILENAKNMCGDFPFVRCDFYITKNSYKFSEMTFFHWGAGQGFEPAKYDKIIGDMMSLPKTKINVADC